MQVLTFDELVEATMRLEPELRHTLVQLLYVSPPAAGKEDTFLQADVLNEAGAYSVFAPLCAEHPHGQDATEADLLAVRAISLL